MMNARTEIQIEGTAKPNADPIKSIRAFADRELPKFVQKIDCEGFYPEQIMRELGRLGAYAFHISEHPDTVDLNAAIEAMAAVAEHCGSTAFCMWCQDALAWYVSTSANAALKREIGAPVARGDILGGTGLSNPMKAFYDIEPMRLKATPVSGGYIVKGVLPYVSNLGEGHYFGAIFEAAVSGGYKRNVMAVIPCAAPGVSIANNTKFTALDGTGTFVVQMRDVFVPEGWILADPIDDYLKKIRAGFVLLQTGMAFGLIRDCIRLMERTRPTLGHVNKFLDIQPADILENLDQMQAEVAALAATPFDQDIEYWRAVLKLRLAASEAAVKAAHGAMLHCGARGYVANAAAQRRLREAYLIAIVTPATKQLRKMLAEMAR
jgi:alkylation response protein AidB-like acyl-CoA dehydrogenase